MHAQKLKRHQNIMNFDYSDTVMNHCNQTCWY